MRRFQTSVMWSTQTIIWNVGTVNLMEVLCCYVWHAGGLAPPTVGNEEMEAANPWAMLLRTFLPWVHAGQVPDYSNQENRQEVDEHTEEAQPTTAIEHGADAAESSLSLREDDDLD